MTISISITGPVQERLQAFSDDLQGEGSKKAIGGGISLLIKAHLGGLDSSRPNKIGGKRTHFYYAAAKNISYESTHDGALVHIHQKGIALHYYGGVIKPTGGRKFLTIPVDPESYGRRAGEFNNLEIAWGRTGGGKPRPIGLVTKNDYDQKTRGKGKKSASKGVIPGKWMYALVLSATIPEDKSVIPSDDLMQAAVLSSLTRYITAKMAGKS
jgi:hypothetical protein